MQLTPKAGYLDGISKAWLITHVFYLESLNPDDGEIQRNGGPGAATNSFMRCVASCWSMDEAKGDLSDKHAAMLSTGSRHPKKHPMRSSFPSLASMGNCDKYWPAESQLQGCPPRCLRLNDPCQGV